MKYFLFLHAINSFVLLACKELLFALVLQIVAIFVYFFQKYRIFFDLFVAMQNILLILVFTISWLYFPLLLLVGSMFWIDYESFYRFSMGRVIGWMLLLFGLYYYFEPLLYEWMFSLDLPLVQHLFDTKLFLLLSVLHAMTLFVLLHLKRGDFKKN